MWLAVSGVLARAAAVAAVSVITAGWRPPAAIPLPTDQEPTRTTAVVRPLAPANARSGAQAHIPAFEFEDEANQSVSYTVLPGGSGGEDPSAPDIPRGPVRVRMN